MRLSNGLSALGWLVLFSRSTGKATNESGRLVGGSLGPGLRVEERESHQRVAETRWWSLGSRSRAEGSGNHQRVVVESSRLVGGGLGRQAVRGVEGSGQGGKGGGTCVRTFS